jgi:hypothetical protein
VADGHIWMQTTADGESYRNQDGRPTPALVDNDPGSSDVQGLLLSPRDDGQGGIDEAILFFLKADVNGNVRLKARAGRFGL